MNKYQEALYELAIQGDKEVLYQDEINGYVSTLQELVSKSDCVIRNETVPLSDDEEFIDRYEDLLNQGCCEDCGELDCLIFHTPRELVKIFRRYQYALNKLCKELASAYPSGVNEYGTNRHHESWKEWAFKEETNKGKNEEKSL